MQGELQRRLEFAGMTHATGCRLAKFAGPLGREVKIGDRGDAGSSMPRLAEARGDNVERGDVAAMPIQQD